MLPPSSLSDQVLSTQELMQVLKIKHRFTIYKLIKHGMPVVRIGRDYRFMQSQVIYFLKNQNKKRIVVKSKSHNE